MKKFLRVRLERHHNAALGPLAGFGHNLGYYLLVGYMDPVEIAYGQDASPSIERGRLDALQIRYYFHKKTLPSS
jgi:hypothetical protein